MCIRDRLEEIKERLIPYMEKNLGTHGETMLFFMLTDIIHESTELLCYGGDSQQLAAEAFHLETPGPAVKLPGAVSYTHLDVYKRQVKRTIVRFTNSLGSYGSARGA